MKFREPLGQKQVGTIYHFTKIDNIKKILSGNKELNLEVLDFVSYNNSISCTRNACMADNMSTFDLSKNKG